MLTIDHGLKDRLVNGWIETFLSLLYHIRISYTSTVRNNLAKGLVHSVRTIRLIFILWIASNNDTKINNCCEISIHTYFVNGPPSFNINPRVRVLLIRR